MGETHSKHKLNYGTLSESEVEKIRKRFKLAKKETNEKISTIDFIYTYPHILRPYTVLMLSSFYYILKKKFKKRKKENDQGFSYASSFLFNKHNKSINVISLQDIINILSYINNIKSRVLFKILFLSFLRYSLSNDCVITGPNDINNKPLYKLNTSKRDENDKNSHQNNTNSVLNNNKKDINKTDNQNDKRQDLYESSMSNCNNTMNIKQNKRSITSDVSLTYPQMEDEESNFNTKDEHKKEKTDKVISEKQNSDHNCINNTNNSEEETEEEGEGEDGGTDSELSICHNSFEFVFSDNDVDVINNSMKRENNFKIIKDNIFFLHKTILKNQYPKNYNLKELLLVEETLHHIFTFMYIEQLYLLFPNNMLFDLGNDENDAADKNILLKKYKTNTYEYGNLINKQNSWGLLFCYNDFFCSLKTNLDFKNIILGFRLFVNSIDISMIKHHSIYTLVVEYINSTFISMSTNYTLATLKHFMEGENNKNMNESENNKNKKDKKNKKENINESISEIDDEDFMDTSTLSIESLNKIQNIVFTKMKNKQKKLDHQNGSETETGTEIETDEDGYEDQTDGKKKDKKSPKLKKPYEKSSSILEIQYVSKGWRGLLLNQCSKILTDEIAFALRQCSPCFMNNEWYRLYASYKEGTSLNRFISAICYYTSPIVIAIKTNDDQILGAVCTTPLKDSHLFHGCSNDFLFAAKPIFRIIRPNTLGKNYVYLNSKNTFYPKGLGFGGKTECFRLFLSDEFKESYCTQSDYTYKSGHLYFPNYSKKKKGNKSNDGQNTITNNSTVHKQYYDTMSEDGDDATDFFLHNLSISEVEAWGCGDEKELEQQMLMQKTEEVHRQERRTTDKSKLFQNNFDKEFLLPKAFVGDKYAKITHNF
ncbi:krox-like protein, putative [Hepatocystis sp. ex Piliocolobus tephrosceles]|nr:krox-like protein, putative [Hepatocystis sp. ex Piliocolobus tephrosceles]